MLYMSVLFCIWVKLDILVVVGWSYDFIMWWYGELGYVLIQISVILPTTKWFSWKSMNNTYTYILSR